MAKQEMTENVPAKIAEAAVQQGQRVENILTQLAGGQQQQPDRMVELVKESVSRMWGREDLKQSAYLQENEYFFEQKMLIIQRWFINYFDSVTVTHKLVKVPYPPYYKMECVETSEAEQNDKFSGQFENFNKDMLELTKGRGGQGMKDLLQMFQGLNGANVEQQRLSLMGRMREGFGNIFR